MCPLCRHRYFQRCRELGIAPEAIGLSLDPNFSGTPIVDLSNYGLGNPMAHAISAGLPHLLTLRTLILCAWCSGVDVSWVRFVCVRVAGLMVVCVGHQLAIDSTTRVWWKSSTHCHVPCVCWMCLRIQWERHRSQHWLSRWACTRLASLRYVCMCVPQCVDMLVCDVCLRV